MSHEPYAAAAGALLGSLVEEGLEGVFPGLGELAYAGEAGGAITGLPYLSISAIVFVLLYVFNPFDIVPDAIPVIGLSDDAAVVAACLTMVEQDLHEYKEWRAEQTDRQLEA